MEIDLRISQIEQEEIDILKPLWEKLNALHADLNPNFRDRYLNKKWEERRDQILSKSESVFIEVAYSKDVLIGYCITTIDKEDASVGELDSLYVEERFRQYGIGAKLTQQSIEWMEGKKVKTQKLLVSYGNDSVLNFYKKFGFEPLHYVLNRRK